MKKQFEIDSLDDFKVGDVIVPNTEPGSITVERWFEDPEPGFGTAIVQGERVYGYIDADGDFGHLNWNGRHTYSAYTDFEPLPAVEALSAPDDFVPDDDEQPAPQEITYDYFLQTMTEVAEDIDLAVGEGYGYAVVHAADRLGLR